MVNLNRLGGTLNILAGTGILLSGRYGIETGIPESLVYPVASGLVGYGIHSLATGRDLIVEGFRYAQRKIDDLLFPVPEWEFISSEDPLEERLPVSYKD